MPYQTANPFANLAQIELQRQDRDMRKQQNALAMQLQQAQLDQYQRQQMQEQATLGAQGGIYDNMDYLDPQNFQQRGGELVSEMSRQNPGANVNSLWQTVNQFRPQAPEYQILDGQYVPKQPGAAAQPIPGYQRPTGYDIQQDDQGNLQYIPKRPGESVVPVGVRGKDRQPTTNVNVDTAGKFGTIPPGYGLRQTPQGEYEMYKIKGGPAEAEDAETARKERMRKAQTARAGGTVIQDIQRALDVVEKNPTASGPLAIIARQIPGTDAYSAEGFVQSALSNVGLDTLQTMRENSPTGGALGQVPIQQQKRLEQVLGSLELPQKREIVIDNLKRVNNIYMDIVHGSQEEIEEAVADGRISEERAGQIGKRYRLTFDEFGNPQGEETPEGPPRIGAIVDGYQFIGGNPADPNRWKRVK